MARKKPNIYLTNGKKHICSFCRCDLITKDKEFAMNNVKNGKSIIVNENILFCSSCKHHFITQGISCRLNAKYPGYYVDVSIYDIKSSKRRKKYVNSKENNIYSEKHQINQFENIISENDRPYDAKIFLLTNWFFVISCLKCGSVLVQHKINVPVYNNDNTIHHNSVEVLKVCPQCKQTYISSEILKHIILFTDDFFEKGLSFKIENVKLIRGETIYDYFFEPTLNNKWLSFSYYSQNEKLFSYPVHYPNGDFFDLNIQSFLGKMGYNINKLAEERRCILRRAMKEYGQEKVCNHLNFLINTRKYQKKNMSVAINIWSKDLEYISNICNY